MPDVVIIGDTFRSPELRNEIPLAVPDPFVYLEHDGARHVYVGSMEAPRIRGLGLDLTVHTLEEIGIDELRAQGFGYYELVSRMGRPFVRPRRADERGRAAHVPERPSRPHPPGGDRADRRPADLRRAAPRQDRTRSSTGSGVHSAPPRPVSRPASRCCASASEQRGHALARRRGTHGRARQAGDGDDVCRARLYAPRSSSSRRGRRAQPGTNGPRADPVRRARRVRPLATGRCFLLLCRHDPNDRRRRRFGSGARVASGDAGGARRRNRVRARRRRVPGRLRHGL